MSFMTLCGDFAFIDQYGNLVFRYYHPDDTNSKDRLQKTISSKCGKLDTDDFIHTPNTAHGFKVRIKKEDITDEIKSFIGTPVEVNVQIHYYQFKKSDNKMVRGYCLRLKSIRAV